MRAGIRGTFDKVFTILTALSVVFISLVLLGILGPMIWKGSSAVVFRGTVEFRKMQLSLFQRGDEEALKAEISETDNFRKVVYEILDKFKRGIDRDALSEEARRIHREFGKELRYKNVKGEEYSRLRSTTRDIRDRLEEAFESQDISEIRKNIENVLKFQNEPLFKNTIAAGFFSMAADFLKSAEQIDLSKQYKYAKSVEEIEQTIRKLLGPRPDEPKPALARLRFGKLDGTRHKSLLTTCSWKKSGWKMNPVSR